MIILASSSPRREELLRSANVEFKVIPSRADEKTIKTTNVEEIPLLEARLKARTVYKTHPHDVVIGADTIVVIDNQAIGKPRDANEEKETLRRLSGRTHRVITSVVIMKDAKEYPLTSVSKVTFKPLSDEEIAAYCKTSEPYDKSGGYAVQGIASKFVLSVEGDINTVIGFPLKDVVNKLKELNVI